LPKTPSSAIDAFKAAVAADANKALKEAALNEIREAVQGIRALAGQPVEIQREALPVAKTRMAQAVQAAMKAEVPQDEIVVATKGADQAEQAVKTSEAAASKEAARSSGGELNGKEASAAPVKPDKAARKVAARAARQAALAAKKAGKTTAEIAKAATAAAKAAGGGAEQIMQAAIDAKKIAAEEIDDAGEEDGSGSESDSSSSSSDSSSAEHEAPISAKEAMDAKLQGFHAAFYFAGGPVK